jgi:hypothetical protein
LFTENAVEEARLPETAAGAGSKGEPGVMIPTRDKSLEVCSRAIPFHEHVSVVRHDAVRMYCKAGFVCVLQ